MWLVAPTGGLDPPCLALSREDTNEEPLGNDHLASPRLRWRRDAIQPPDIQQVRLDRTRASIFLVTAFDASPGTREGLLDHLLHQFSSEMNNNYFTRNDKNNIIFIQGIHGKHEFLQAIQVLHPQFRLYGTFIPNNLKRRRIGHLHSQESALFHFSSCPLNRSARTLQGKTPQSMELYARCPGLIERRSF